MTLLIKLVVGVVVVALILGITYLITKQNMILDYKYGALKYSPFDKFDIMVKKEEGWVTIIQFENKYTVVKTGDIETFVFEHKTEEIWLEKAAEEAKTFKGYDEVKINFKGETIWINGKWVLKNQQWKE